MINGIEEVENQEHDKGNAGSKKKKNKKKKKKMKMKTEASNNILDESIEIDMETLNMKQ